MPNAVLIPLTLAQLYLSQDNIEKAVSSLEAVGSSSFPFFFFSFFLFFIFFFSPYFILIANVGQYPLVVALLVLCYENLGKLDQAFALLDKISEVPSPA